MVEANVAVEKKQKQKPLIPKVERFLGMHNGTVSGKGFEKSRRARKTHAERRAEISARARSKR